MQPSEIAESYDRIAHDWLHHGLDQNGILQHERALKFRPRGGWAIDIGCGCNGRFFRLLTAHGYEVEGLDISARMLALGRERFPATTFHHADLCTWQPDRSYDFITAWDSLWHVPLSEAEHALRKLCSILSPGGILITTTGGLDAPEEKCDSSMGVPVSYSVLGIPRILQILAESNCVCRHLEYDQFPEKHLYFIAQKVVA